MALTRLCRHNRDGSRATQANRLRGLKALATDLHRLGYKLPRAESLKPKHVTALVADWQSRDLNPATLKNRLGWVRWWAEKVNKASVVPRANAALGIDPRGAAATNRAWQLADDTRLADPHMQTALELMSAFGLRLEEALKIRPHDADHGQVLRLQGSWTKGGRPRDIPIRTAHQRALLAKAQTLVGQNSLIPTDRSYIRHRKAFEYQALKAGLSNVHGLRHAYAQTRYAELTGWACPKQGGPLPKNMTSVERRLDRQARLIVAAELGHGRVSITATYLG
nr:phage integrase N-terminal domain-containing protein [Rhodobium orientis]